MRVHPAVAKCYVPTEGWTSDREMLSHKKCILYNPRQKLTSKTKIKMHLC